jgi:hypothetical protein
MSRTVTRLVPYEGNRCPRCGWSLRPPDELGDRRCSLCPITVCAAIETITYEGEP